MEIRRQRSRKKEKKPVASKVTVSPRRLARSVAKFYGKGVIEDDWKERIARLPKTGRKYLHPEVHRMIRDCSGSVGGQV